MKILNKLFNILMLVIVLFTIVSAVGSAITKEPILFSVIRSNSMYPVWERGDMVVVENLNDKAEVKIGDIIFYKAEEGELATKGWIAHRVVAGNEKDGYIAKGDANEEVDETPVMREWISGRAFTIGETPIVISNIGFVSLWVELAQSNPYVLPIFAVILAVIIGISELTSGNKHRKKKKEKGIELQLIYIIAGVTIAVLLAATMMSTSQKFNIVYEVSEDSPGVLMGSSVGVLKLGDVVTKPLTTLNNGGFFNLIGTITTNDEQITLGDTNIKLKPKETIESEFTVKAENPGLYKSTIQVGLFYPFLPASIIHYLTSLNYWLALVIVSLIPGLPFMLYPFFDGKMRRGIIASLRKRKNQLVRKVSF